MDKRDGLRQRDRTGAAAAAQLGKKEQQALELLSKAQRTQTDLEKVEARMAEIASQVDSGLNRDVERNLLQEMSKLRQLKQSLQTEAMAALDAAAGLTPASNDPTMVQGSGGEISAAASQPNITQTKMSRAQRSAAESTPGALLKAGTGRESDIDWCALLMVYVKAAAMFALVFWLVRSQVIFPRAPRLPRG